MASKRTSTKGLDSPHGTPAPATPAPVANSIVIAGLALASILLAIHVRVYSFLTDDAFISFRYARNLADGHGLVFNPGGERVEGYTNLLWVLLLAGLDAIGVAPERAAMVLSIVATAALFGIVVAFAWSRAPRGQEWIVLLPAFFLASTRSFAVWATSGLETRFFELLLVGGLLRLVLEVESLGHGNRPLFLSPWLLGLATLTRPDGLLFAGCTFLAAAIHRARTSRRIPWDYLATWWPLAALVIASFAFRLAYYGEWLPNTYYAKVGGHLSWDRGVRYLAAFGLEYGAILWLPGLAAAVVWHRRRQTPFVPLLFAAAVLPHALYVAAIGGDHFEHRPVDAYLPLVFLLLADGAHQWASSKAAARLVPAYAAIVVFGLAWLPARMHRDFPKEYRPGFPGAFVGRLPEAEHFLAPERDPVFRLPILKSYARAHRDLVREQTVRLIAIRQEEHRLFSEEAAGAARRVNILLERGFLPRDVYVALDCIGIVPYRTNLRTLDRVGLTDAHVAHSPFVTDVMAHGKWATLDYARERGVDLWTLEPVSLVCPPGSSRVEGAIREGQAGGSGIYAVDLGGGNLLVCVLPQGLEAARQRMPRLPFQPIGDRAIAASYVRHFVPEFLGYVRQGQVGPARTKQLGEICVIAGELAAATSIYEEATRAWPRDWEFFWMLTRCRILIGDVEGANASLGQAIEILRQDGDARAVERLLQRFESIRREGPPQLGAPASGAGSGTE